MPERLRFEREITELGLREYDNSPIRREVTVGERIVVNITDFIPADTEVKDVQWTIPGTVVASYVGDRKRSDVWELKPANFKKPKVTFYWVDAIDGRTVQVRITLKSGSKQEFSYIFDVKGPTLDHFKDKADASHLAGENGLPVIRFGVRDKAGRRDIKKGVQWDWQVTMPARQGGFIKDLQTIIVRQEETRATGRFVRQHPTKKEQHEQLDQSFFDEGTEATYSTKGAYDSISFPTKVEAGKSFRDNKTYDSPGTRLESNGTKASVNNSFKYYILYKPLTPGAIWVPVAKAEWFWQAEVAKASSKWVLKSKDGKVTAKGAATVKFPLYESNVNQNDWIEVK
ncbi:MAG: hypothetical protein WBV94_10915 [Blastocatellia bacterium]